MLAIFSGLTRHHLRRHWGSLQSIFSRQLPMRRLRQFGKRHFDNAECRQSVGVESERDILDIDNNNNNNNKRKWFK